MQTISIGGVSIGVPALVWVALCGIWGSTWLGVRIGLNDLPPFTFAGLRFLMAAAVLLAALWVRGTPLPHTAAHWRLIVVTALLGFAISYAAQFWGMQFVPSGLAAVMFATVPFFTMVFAHVALPSEPLTLPKLGGVVLGLGGVAIIFADQLAVDSTMAVWGVVGFLVASATYAGAQVIVKARGSELDPMVLAGFQMAIAGILLFGLGAAVEGNPLHLRWTRSAVAALCYLALIGSALAFVMYYWLLQHMDVTKTTSMMLVLPPVAVVLGWLVLGETLGWRVLLGAATILGGLALILRPSPRRVASRSGGGAVPLSALGVVREARR